jgi:hypothetical protein
MATKKQQRRRKKYEYVYVDDEGNEVEPPKAPAAGKTDRKATAATAKGQPRGRGRVTKPPSWQRAFKWAGVYTAFMLFMTLSTQKKGASIAPSIMLAVVFGLVVVPGVYWMHRLQYRTSLKQSERQAAAKSR